MKKKICVSDLKHLIEIYTREHRNNKYTQVDYNVEYKPYHKAYAKISTKPIPMYNGINPSSLSTEVTHIFTIKYTSKRLDNGYSIKYKEKEFLINGINNIDEENKYIELYAKEEKEFINENINF